MYMTMSPNGACRHLHEKMLNNARIGRNPLLPISVSMKPRRFSELATSVTKTLLGSALLNPQAQTSASARTREPFLMSWTTSLEQSLHGLIPTESLTPNLVRSVIAHPSLAPYPSLSLSFFTWCAQQPNYAHDAAAYDSVIRSLSASRNKSAARRLLREVKARDFMLEGRTYEGVLAFFLRNGMADDGFWVFCEMIRRDCEVGMSACNGLLGGLECDGRVKSALKVFDEMILRGVGFNTLGIGLFLWRFCRGADVEGILRMVDEVLGCSAGKNRIDGSVVVVLIVHGLCEELRVEDANVVLDELRNRGWKPDFIAYRVVAEEFGRLNDMVGRQSVLKRKRKLGVAPRMNEYTEFLFSLISERRIREAKELCEVIVTGDFQLQEDVLNSLIGTVSADYPDHGVDFLKYMIGKGKSPTLLTLTNLGKNLVKHGRSNELVGVYDLLASENYFNDTESYNVIISSLCDCRRVKEAYGILQEMRKRRFDPDISSYNLIFEACCKDDLIRPAKKLWDEMFSYGCKANLRTYEILIGKFSAIGELEEAERLLSDMLAKGLQPNQAIYRPLILGLCDEGKAEAAWRTFDVAIKQDMSLAQDVLGAFVLCLCRNGTFDTASRALTSLPGEMINTEAHVTFPKWSADADKMTIAFEHVKWLREKSPFALRAVLAALTSPVSSTSGQDRLLKLLDMLQAGPFSNDFTTEQLRVVDSANVADVIL